MLYTDFKGEKLSRLGFGMMRLPIIEGGKDSDIDEEECRKMADYAYEHGVNYFDTAKPYHGEMSEIVTGKLLKRYPRDSFYLATKYPGHMIAKKYEPEKTFEIQLEKCGVDYFDFYLLHNVGDMSWKVYSDPQWGILEYFLKEKEHGRIRHLGFSSHSTLPVFEKILDSFGKHMEFCQLQINYLDWEVQDGRKKVEMLKQLGIPVWVMEPIRGGFLANKIPESFEKKMKEARPDESLAAWALRWLIANPDLKLILSGMSNFEQMKDNIRTFEEEKPLNAGERLLLDSLSDEFKDFLPCTACRYCCAGCPMGLDIPGLIAKYNDFRIEVSGNVRMLVDALPEDKRPSACIACKACEAVCPQQIKISEAMADFAELLKKAPDWEVVSKLREEAAEKLGF